jgi:hypothetical protein
LFWAFPIVSTLNASSRDLLARFPLNVVPALDDLRTASIASAPSSEDWRTKKKKKKNDKKPRPSGSQLWKDKTLTEDSSISKSFFACWRISKENERKKKKTKRKTKSQKNTPSLLMARLENKMDFL